jgi:hypothetical protein
VDSIKRLATAMGFVALAILDVERHKLQGLVAWHFARAGRLGELDDVLLRDRLPRSMGAFQTA